MTDKIRAVLLWTFVISVIVGLVGWFNGLNPEALLPILGPQTAALGIGEASNVGKRATSKGEVIDAETRRLQAEKDCQ